MYKLKIVLLGPTKSGKSSLANFLSDASENPITDNYRPTRVVRILEFEVNNISANNRHVRADVELWDSSGNVDYENSWPAIIRDAHGVVFVFDPQFEDQARDLDVFYSQLVEKNGLTDSQCIVLANTRPNKRGGRNSKLSTKFNRIPQLEINIEDEGNRVRNDFNTFLGTLITNLSERNEQDEINIMRH